MKYFLDTEFLEGAQNSFFGKTKPTIDLISIGIISEDGREYYAISKEFNLKEAWNRYDLKPDIENGGMKKIYWIRDNVLKPIFDELFSKFVKEPTYGGRIDMEFLWSNLRYLINIYGKTNEQIAEEIIDFCKPISRKAYELGVDMVIEPVNFPEFYAYYADYDWVVFCWLFGKMTNLPKGFPRYCIDLKQMIDEEVSIKKKTMLSTQVESNLKSSFISKDDILKTLKSMPNYPKQENEHDALSDAKWNKKLYEFLQTL